MPKSNCTKFNQTKRDIVLPKFKFKIKILNQILSNTCNELADYIFLMDLFYLYLSNIQCFLGG